MNILLIIVQIGLALHTGVGAIWKLMNPAALLPMFPMIPAAGFTVISVLELIAAALLLLPFVIKSLRGYGWIVAAFVALEMLAFTVIYLGTGTANYSPTYYWIVVAAVAGFFAYMKRIRKVATSTGVTR